MMSARWSISWPKIYCIGGVVSAALYGMLKKQKKKKIDVFPEATHNDPLIDKMGHLINYKGTWLPKFLFPKEQTFINIKEFSVHPSDIMVSSFPKSGTTWVQEIVWHILSLADNPEDLLSQSSDTIEDRFPYLEYVYPGLKEISKRPSPRLIKTHLPYHLLPADVDKGLGRVIYIARNPKDVCVSYYHFLHLLSFLRYKGDFNHFFENFMNGTVGSGPWLDHVRDYWLRKDQENILFITYEELHNNREEVIERISTFLGKPVNRSQLLQIVNVTSFESMKKNDKTNYSWWSEIGLTDRDQGDKKMENKTKKKQGEKAFMRKGIVGDWKNYMTKEMNKQVEVNLLRPLKNLDLNFQNNTTATSSEQKR